MVTTRRWTVPDVLATGLDLQPLPTPPVVIPDGPVPSRLSGQWITEGYPLAEMLGTSAADRIDATGGDPTGWVSDTVARCLKAANPRLRSGVSLSMLIFAGERALHPLESRASAAEQGRPCWSDLVREIWPERRGDTVLIIVTADTKKRIWQDAQLGVLGSRTPVLHYDRSQARAGVRRIDWPVLIDTLDAIEEVYDRGFTKRQIAHGLLSATAARQQNGSAWTVAAERRLLTIRQRESFPLALTFAQHSDTEE